MEIMEERREGEGERGSEKKESKGEGWRWK